MKSVCKMTGQEVAFPCSYAGCPLFGDCLVAYEKATVKPMTNADHIRSMTDEELAEWLVLRTVYQESAWSAPSYLNFKTGVDDTLERAIEGTADWLKQPYGGYP